MYVSYIYSTYPSLFLRKCSPVRVNWLRFLTPHGKLGGHHGVGESQVTHFPTLRLHAFIGRKGRISSSSARQVYSPLSCTIWGGFGLLTEGLLL